MHSNKRLRNTELGKTVSLQHKAFKMEKYSRRNSGDLWKGRLLSRDFGGGIVSLHAAQPTVATTGRAHVCDSAQAPCGGVHKAIISQIFEHYGKKKTVVLSLLSFWWSWTKAISIPKTLSATRPVLLKLDLDSIVNTKYICVLNMNI